MFKMETKISTEDSEKLISEQVPQIRKILEEKQNLIVPAHCNDLIARCIRMKDGNLENAIKLVKEFYSCTAKLCSWDAKFQPSSEIALYGHGGTMMVIAQRDHIGRIVFTCRVGMWKPEELNFDQAIACIWMLLQYISAQSKGAQRSGIVTIWDFTEYSMKHILATTKRKCPFIARLVQNGLAGRIKEFHVINHPKILSIFYNNFMKLLMKEKVRKRVIFHDNLETLHAHVDKNGLPNFAGGDKEIEECIDSNFMKEFIAQDQYFIDMMNDRFPRF